MRIAYGVFGYGRGHATRALSVLPDLARRHEVLVFAGGTAQEALAPSWPVRPVPTLGYVYGASGRISAWRTARDNAALVRDLLWGGPALKEVTRALRDFQPDVVVSDAEPFTHLGARKLGVPRIGFDHFGLLAHCRPQLEGLDRIRVLRDVLTYHLLTGNPHRVIVSSFFTAPARRPGVRCIPTLLRDDAFAFRPRAGRHLLAYFNRGEHQLTAGVLDALRSLRRPVIVYGAPFAGADENLCFRPADNRTFLEDLASCAALVSTAGNQLVGEALHFGKPLLVMPEATVEQRVNALAVERLGVGIRARDPLQRGDLDRLLLEAPRLADAARRRAADGRAEAVAVLERYAAELSAAKRRARAPVWRPA